ncbi:hypothetical protein N431DRAFT_101392 [Stipitochalara longipes BDJ]|nr:hypothetical protein N431DRAFT_101392 [Stipitochalara longipes BDJ]
MCALPPEWEIAAGVQRQPIIFPPASFNKSQYKLTPYNNGHFQPVDWTSEQESHDSDNDGDMFSILGSSPADSNNHDQLKSDELTRSERRRLFGEIQFISDLESSHSYGEGEGIAHYSALEHRFASYRRILVRESSGWHGKSWSWNVKVILELNLASNCVFILRDLPPSALSGSSG